MRKIQKWRKYSGELRPNDAAVIGAQIKLRMEECA
jgi:hypothetical protein